MTIENKNSDNETKAVTQKSDDAKLILAPLAKYAAVAVIMVSIIITTVIMVNRELNTIDRDVASLKEKLANANAITEAEENTLSDAVVTVDAVSNESITPSAEAIITVNAEQEPDSIQKTESVAIAIETQNNAIDTAAIPTTLLQPQNTETGVVADSTVEIEAVEKSQEAEQLAVNKAQPNQVATTQPAPHTSRLLSLKASLQARIADRNDYLKTRDHKNLEELRVSQQKMIEWMRQQIDHQQEIIEEMRARNQDAYEMRAASMKRMQEARDRSLEKI